MTLESAPPTPPSKKWFYIKLFIAYSSAVMITYFSDLPFLLNYLSMPLYMYLGNNHPGISDTPSECVYSDHEQRPALSAPF